MNPTRILTTILLLAALLLAGCTRQLATSPVEGAVNPTATLPPDVATIQAISAELTQIAGGQPGAPDVDLAATAAAVETAVATPPPQQEPQPTLAPTQPAVVATTLPTASGISGGLRAPNKGDDPLPVRVSAYNLESGLVFTVDTSAGQASYELHGLPPGRYHVLGFWLEGGGAAGYTAAVVCGMKKSCTDHSLLEVVVADGAVTTGVDLFDWEVADALPPRP